MKFFILVIGLITFLSSCTLEVGKMFNGPEDDYERNAYSNSHNKRTLPADVNPRAGNILNDTTRVGKSFLIVPPLGPLVPGGKTAMEETVTDIKPTAEFQFNGEDLTLSISAFPLNGASSDDRNQVLLQGVLDWQTGSALFGNRQEESKAGFNNVVLSPEIVFDVQHGTNLLIPACTSLSLRMRYTVNTLGSFSPGVALGPTYRVNVGLSFGTPKSNLASNVTRTDKEVSLLHAGGTTGFISKYPYDKAISFIWTPYAPNPPDPAAGPLQVAFVDFNGNVFAEYNIAANTLPFPIVEWPAASSAAFFMNLDPTNDIDRLTPIHYLSF